MKSSPTPQSFPRSFTFRLRDCADSASAHCAGRLAPGEYPSTFFPGKRRGQLPEKVRLAFLPYPGAGALGGAAHPPSVTDDNLCTRSCPYFSPPTPATSTFRPSLLRLDKTARPLCAERASSNRVIGSLSHRVIERLSDCVIENRKESLHARNPQPVPGAKPAPALPTGKGPGGRGGHSIACWPDHSVAQLPQSPEAGAL